MFKPTVVMPVLFMIILVWHALPVCASIVSVDLWVADPKQFPQHKTINILEGSHVSQEEEMVINEWLWPFMDELPDTVFLGVSRSEPDQWIKSSHVRIFLLKNGACILGNGNGETFEQAIKDLARNLLRQGYLVSELKASVNPPQCRP